MKLKNFFLILLILFITITTVSTIAASDVDISDEGNIELSTDCSDINLAESDFDFSNLNQKAESNIVNESEDVGLNDENNRQSQFSNGDNNGQSQLFTNENNNSKSQSNDNSILQSNIIYVDGSSPNQMNNPTIQNAINSANPGDTIVITGSYYEHCHFIVDKQLTIISSVGTVFSPCSQTSGSDHQGIFYLNSKASGTIIDGFTFVDDLGLYDDWAYGILMGGLSNVSISNCYFNNTKTGDGIRVERSQNINLENISIIKFVNGIKIIDSKYVNITDSIFKNATSAINITSSNYTEITYNNIGNCKISGINIAGNSYYTQILYNNITNNGFSAVNLTSTNFVNISNNYIAENKFGVYVNVNITRIDIVGNFFYLNERYDVFNDYRTLNLASGGLNVEFVNNNYMVGLGDRPVYNFVYYYVGTNKGEYTYDSENDIYNYVGENNGDYSTNKDPAYLGYIFGVNEYLECPVIYYEYELGPWIYSGNYYLYLTEIKQVKKGIYSISIVDINGNIASDISSVYVTFYLNKKDTKSTPQEGDVYKTVLMENGTATVRFYKEEFEASDNNLTVVFPTNSRYYNDQVAKTLKIEDSQIPGIATNTTFNISNLTTYPNSGVYFSGTLTGIDGSPVSNELINYTLNSNKLTTRADENGTFKIKVSLSKEGTYILALTYEGDGVDFYGTNGTSKINVKRTSTKIIASNLNMIPNRAEYYSVTLKTSSGTPISGEKLIFYINGKKYSTQKTNSKGIAKIKLKYKQSKSYKVMIKHTQTNKYKASSVTKTIKVKYSSKAVKLIVPSITIPPKTKSSYTITLNNDAGKGISKQKIKIKLNGKTYTKTTSNKGKITISVKFNSLKTYKVTANYAGSKIYRKATSSGKIKVSKTQTKIITPNMDVTPNTTKSYTISLKTSGSKAISKGKLTIKLNGKTYTKTTNSKGQVSLNIKLPDEKTYSLTVNYNGNTIYKPSKSTAKINVSKSLTIIRSFDRRFSINSTEDYVVSLIDSSGNILKNQNISYSINDNNFTVLTDDEGQISIPVSYENPSSFTINLNYGGSEVYMPVSKSNIITVVDKINTTFIGSNLDNDEIQRILDSSNTYHYIEFIDAMYEGLNLYISNPSNIYSTNKALLKGLSNKSVFIINCDNVVIDNFEILSNSSNAILVNSSNNVSIINNNIANLLEESKIDEYMCGNISLPGSGISIVDSKMVNILSNHINLYENGIYAQYSGNITMSQNIICENNYGITYGYGVSNTLISNNNIKDCVGLYIMTVPEGPSGYGIYLNNSAVNVTILSNNISSNHIGISLDSNYSTGIVVKSNSISDNVLEGMRFNAGYDVDPQGVEPVVTDNAIYRNAKGPSMMILGELSANPFGIYGGGLYNDSQKLHLDANWYGTNSLVTWDNDTGVVGYGTMCPRIKTYEIKFDEVTSTSPGTFKIEFKKDGVLDDKLPVFDMYAVLNRGTQNEVEIQFNVTEGIGEFSFSGEQFITGETNIIDIAILSLNDHARLYKVCYTYEVPQSEIPV